MISKITSFSPKMALGLSLLMILSGCGGSELKTRSLSTLPKTHGFTSSNNSIEGHYTLLNAKACRSHLGRNVLKKGYQPLYITLTNNSDHTVYVSVDSINLPTVPAEKVAYAVHTSTVGRATGLGAVGIGLGASVIYSALFIGYLVGGLIAIPLGVVGVGACITPAIVTSTKSVRTNEDIDVTFEEVSLRSQTLAPGHSTSGIVFVPKKSFDSDFTITITDGMSNQITLHS